jgi:hypothetical protein
MAREMGMNGGKFLNRSKWYSCGRFIAAAVFVSLVPLAPVFGTAKVDTLYVTAFFSETIPDTVCAFIMYSSGEVKDSCSTHVLQIGSTEMIESHSEDPQLNKEVRKFLVAIPLAGQSEGLKPKESESGVVFLMEQDTVTLRRNFLPVQPLEAKRFVHLSSYDEQTYHDELRNYKNQESEIEEEVKNIQLELHEKKQLLTETPEGKKYTALKKKVDQLEFYKANFEEHTADLEERISNFMRTQANTPDHKQVKNELSSKIKKLIEMSLKK